MSTPNYAPTTSEISDLTTKQLVDRYNELALLVPEEDRPKPVNKFATRDAGVLRVKNIVTVLKKAGILVDAPKPTKEAKAAEKEAKAAEKEAKEKEKAAAKAAEKEAKEKEKAAAKAAEKEAKEKEKAAAKADKAAAKAAEKEAKAAEKEAKAAEKANRPTKTPRTPRSSLPYSIRPLFLFHFEECEQKAFREGSKYDMMIQLMSSKEGATMPELKAATDSRGMPWSYNIIRGALVDNIFHRGYNIQSSYKDGVFRVRCGFGLKPVKVTDAPEASAE
jgi:hypothetical protein